MLVDFRRDFLELERNLCEFTTKEVAFNLYWKPQEEIMDRSIYLTTILFLMLASLGFSQVADKKVLTLEGAQKVIAAAVVEAKKDVGTGVIAVVDDGGNLMALVRLDNTFPAGANISIGKARTAAIFKKPTSAFEDIIKNGRTAMVALSDFTPLQGGLPIMIGDQVIGAVGVSGAASAARDTEIATAGANAISANAMQGSSAASYFDKDQVAAAFAKGVPILEMNNYKINASRRDSAGMVEVHLRDTDIIYVTDGSAIFVTGGTMVDGKTVAPDEIRGKEITGGETRTLVKGDVIVVPHGTPHWFKEVQAPFLYYVVKVS